LQNDAYKSAKPEQWQEDQEMFVLKEATVQKLSNFLKLLG